MTLLEWVKYTILNANPIFWIFIGSILVIKAIGYFIKLRQKLTR